MRAVDGHVNLSQQKLSSDELSALLHQLAPPRRVESLWLEDCDLGNQGVATLAEAISRGLQIQEVILTGNSITDNGLLALGKCISANAIGELHVGRNLFTYDGIDSFSDLIKESTSLRTLNFQRTGMTDRSAVRLVSTVVNLPQFEDLYIDSNRLTSTVEDHLRELTGGRQDVRIHAAQQHTCSR